MTDPSKNAEARGTAGSGVETEMQGQAESTAALAASQRRFTVIVDGVTHKVWGHYRTEAEALAACAALRRHGFLARIERGSP